MLDYVIRANQTYTLALLSPELQDAMPLSNALFIGKVYYRFDELPSTNDWAAEFIASSQKSAAKTRPPEGTVVQAANQTAGKGQLGSRWQSTPGENLLISIILYPTWLHVHQQFYLSMAMALGVRDLLMQLSTELNLADGPIQRHTQPLQVAVKWPNDLYLNNHKTAGILIQNSLSGTSLQSSIVGIGLNINQIEFPEAIPNATSLTRSLGVFFDIDKVANRLFGCLERRYLQLKAGQKLALKEEYEAHLWRRGIPAQFIRTADQTSFKGIIQGVTEHGHLLIQTETEMVEFEVKAVSAVI